MNFFIFCLAIIDAWTDVLWVVNPKKELPNLLSSEGEVLISASTAEAWAKLITPGIKEKIDEDRVEQVLNVMIPTIASNYKEQLQEEAKCEECDIHEFVYEKNYRMMQIFDTIEEKYGPRLIAAHRNNWFHPAQIPDNLKPLNLDYIINQFRAKTTIKSF